MDVMIHEVATSEKKIAITFDDGPNPVYTPQVLEIFSKVGGKATFFMIGDQMLASPELVKRVVEEGHEIGNHTFTHPKLSEVSVSECLAEWLKTENLVMTLTETKPVVCRVPYLDYNEETVQVTRKLGLPMIGALNLEAMDWELPGVEHIVEKSRETVRNGSILIFHDGYGDRSQTIEAVRILVQELVSEGYQLVTVSELLRTS